MSAIADLIDIAEENATKYGLESLAKNCRASRAELAQLRSDLATARSERDEARARVAELEAAGATLTNRLRYVHNDSEYKSVWFTAQNHRGEYRGPQYDKELAALELVLEDCESAPLTPRRCTQCDGCNPLKPEMKDATDPLGVAYANFDKWQGTFVENMPDTYQTWLDSLDTVDFINIRYAAMKGAESEATR